jgi:23S rRNA (uracil1939-C5)-methyltransferase
VAKSPPPRKRLQKAVQHAPQPRLWGKDELQIDRMSQEGRGIATRQGKVVFVSGALAGEQVRVQCATVKRDYDEASMLELVAGTDPAGARVEPECPLYRDCGGCTLQHWSLAAQQAHKQANLLAMLQPLAPGLVLDAPITSSPRGYRHRLRVMVQRNADHSYWLGMRRRGSHEAVAVSHCLVANSPVNALLQSLPTMLAAVPELQGLREIEIDSDSNEKLGLCCYFAANPGERALASLRAAVLKAPVVALRVRLAAPRKSRRDDPWDDAGDDLAAWQELYAEGELCLCLPMPGDSADSSLNTVQLAYLPGDFTQTHWEVNAALVTRALAWLQPHSDERALDLFCGIGNFALPLARHAGAVEALEGDASMTQRLDENAARNGIKNIRARTLNLMAESPVLPRADIAIIDPPRAGAKAVCDVLAGAGVKRLVYISCHPATLARDARLLQTAGFALERAAAVDMFPHTGHSEAITLFRRVSKR